MSAVRALVSHTLEKLRQLTYVFPRAGSPTVTIAILPEWNRRPDSVLYSCAGAISSRWGKSWIASIKVLDFRRNRGELAATSAVLEEVVSKLFEASHIRQGLAHSQAISCENHILGSMVAYRRVSITANTTSNSRPDNIGVQFSLYCQEVGSTSSKSKEDR